MGHRPARPARAGPRDHAVQLPAQPDGAQGRARRSRVGAPVVQKPASQTPLSAFALREIVLAAGWPEEAYAVLAISGREAERLVTDPRLPVVSFTGSAAVGWRLRRSRPRKRVGLELGGNAAVVVHADADLDDAAARVAAGGFVYAGQSCISVQRTLVHRPSSTPSATPPRGDGGAASRRPARRDDGRRPDDREPRRPRARGAGSTRPSPGARSSSRAGRARARSSSPTVLAGTTRDMKVEAQEVFAPVVTLTPYDTWDEALARVNDSKYGLQAGVFTRDLGRIQRAFDVLEVGAVIVNDVPTWRADRMPYGGVKDSGIGREGPLYAMEEFTEPRLLVLRP